MDSMRSLNTSLPHSSSRRARSAQPSGELLQAFKAAALSVTQLYKTAASDEDTARTAGYQDAIDELLAFLDAEDLGLGDGEGWRVRQWATERLSSRSYGSEGEDNGTDNEVSSTPNYRTSSSSTTKNVKSEHKLERNGPTDSSSPEPQSKTSIDASSSHQDPNQTQASPNVFHFRSSVSLPTLQGTGDSEMANGEPSVESTVNNNTNTPVVRLVPRTSKSLSSSRDVLHASRLAGLKRKPNISDFFDFDSIGRDASSGTGGGGGGGGGKKVRFA